MRLLSIELFGQSLSLPEFPKLKAIRGLGMTDKQAYADLLADRFDYTNTHYDREPRFDFTGRHPQLAGTYDFILSADVLEHIAPPVERALEEACRLLKPHGFLSVTVYCSTSDKLRAFSRIERVSRRAARKHACADQSPPRRNAGDQRQSVFCSIKMSGSR